MASAPSGTSRDIVLPAPTIAPVDTTGAGVQDAGGRWISPADPGELGLAAPVKKLLEQLHGPRQAGLL